MSADPALSPQGRRDVIVEKAAQLLARKGIAATTIREIGDAAGILSGSLYYHFDSKDAIIDAVMSTYLDDLLERYRVVLEDNNDVKSRFQGLVAASLRAVEAHPHATAVYQHDAHYFRRTPRFRYVRLAAEGVRQTWIGVLEAGVTEGVFRNDIPARYLYLLLRDGLWLTVRWFRPSSAYGVDEFAADCCRLYYQALASEEALRTMLESHGDAGQGRRG
ncbi:MAG: TetR/AcrR family transcriptional regulator, cholesterol catabolism regulator [Micromonosporaceae bacterium]|nr:TetR/AcrR family transcriptional regulator, cholesterol catabolism regulator [Micromonosporaceae bacterium]